MATPAEEHETKRGDIESEYNGLRDTIEKQYVIDKGNLERDYHEAIQANAADKAGAMLAAGLNSDGSEPYGRPTG